MKNKFNIISTEPETLLKEKRRFVDRKIPISVKFHIDHMGDIKYLTVNIASFGTMIFKIAALTPLIFLLYVIVLNGSIINFFIAKSN